MMKMEKISVNGEDLTKETILKTRKWYSDVVYRCIEEVKTGKCHIYGNKEDYYKTEVQSAKRYMNGENDRLIAFMQQAYYIQTGNSVAILAN